MNKNTWITTVAVAIVFGGGGFYGGMKYQAAKAPAAFGGGSFAARAGGAAGRFGAGAGAAAGGGFTAGTIIQSGNGSITIQLANSTSSTATTGSKIVLVDDSTMISKTTSGSMSDLSVGQGVTVSGTANSDGSITATMIQIRPAGFGSGRATQGATTPTTGQ